MNRYATLFATTLLLLLGAAPAQAQTASGPRAAGPSALPSHVMVRAEDGSARAVAPQSLAAEDRRRLRAAHRPAPVQRRAGAASSARSTTITAPNGNTFTINYNGLVFENGAAKGAFEYAVRTWTDHLLLEEDIVIYASSADLGDSVLGAVSQNTILISSSVAYPTAFDNKFQSGTTFRITFNNFGLGELGGGGPFDGADPYYYGAAPPSSFEDRQKLDFATLAMHMMGHGLGIDNKMSVENGVGTFFDDGFGDEFTLFSTFIENDLGEQLIGTYESGTTALGSVLTSGSGALDGLYFGGLVTNAVSGILEGTVGGRVRLYTPTTWDGTASVRHFDDATYDHTTYDGLMTARLEPGELRRGVGSYTCAVIADLIRAAGGHGAMGPGCKIARLGTIYVDRDATGANNGSSWENAYTNLQDALAVVDGHDDEIWIAEGTYTPLGPDSAPTPLSSLAIEGSQDGVEIYGGFDGTETSRGQRDPAAHETILSGDVDGDGTLNGNSYNVVALSGADTEANITRATVLDGLTITGGNARDGAFYQSGGGLICIGRGSGNACNPTLRNLIFTGNHADINGGALFNNGDESGQSSPALINVVFAGNDAGAEGGAMYNSAVGGESSPAITGAVFTGNRAGINGGAIKNGPGFGPSEGGVTRPTIINATFHDNSAELDGGAIFNYGGNSNESRLTIINAIFAGNRADSDDNGSGAGDAISSSGSGAAATVRYSLLAGGENSVSDRGGSVTNYENAGGTAVDFSASTNLAADPQFANENNPDGEDNNLATADDGLRLSVGSVALDYGKGPVAIDTDVTGAPRVQGLGGIDLGAYEGAYVPGVIYVDAGAPAGGDGRAWESAYQNLTSALNRATGSSEIWIANGTYTPGSDRADSFTITGAKDGLKIYGGFGGYETRRDERPPSDHPTILSGDVDGDDSPSSNSYHVVLMDGRAQPITNATVLSGVTITAGNANGDALSGYSVGGGLYCTSVSGSECSPTLTGIAFVANSASAGGAIHAGLSAGVMGLGNQGGASSPVITNALFIGNEAQGGEGVFRWGGAIASAGASALVLRNATFFGNRANKGGALAAHSGAGDNTPSIANTIFYGNTANEGAEIYTTGSVETELTHTLVEGGAGGIANLNGATVTYIGPDGSPAADFASSTNLAGDPQFGNASDPAGQDGVFATTDDGLRLIETSPAVDAGDNAAVPGGGATDITGADRIQGGTVNLGAYEILDDRTRILFVDADAPSGGDGTSWATAYTALQDAIDDASGNDEIWVAAGTYIPTFRLGGDFSRRATFYIDGARDGIQIYGGFDGTEGSGGGARESRRDARDPVAHETMLSGDLGTADDAADNSFHVLYLDGREHPITQATVLDGMTVTGGNGSNGGGLYCDGAGGMCSPTLRRLRFMDNSAEDFGGAIYNAAITGESSPAIIDGVFTNNSARSGGGVYNDAQGEEGRSSPAIVNTAFVGNRAGINGGAISGISQSGGESRPKITNTLFADNRAGVAENRLGGAGGAIYTGATGSSAVSNLTVTNATFTGNRAAEDGGAVSTGDGTSQLTNVILWDNTADADGDGRGAGDAVYGSGDATVELAHALVEGGCPAGVTCSDLVAGTPQFAAGGSVQGPDGVLGTDDDGLRLAARSPAIDAGDQAALPNDDFDLDGDNSGRVTIAEPIPFDLTGAARTQGGDVDLGAYETAEGIADTEVTLFVDRGNTTGTEDGRSWATAFRSLQDALAVAAGGDQIWIAGGTYYPDEGAGLTDNDRAASFRITGAQDSLRIYGGFAGDEASLADRNLAASETILSGDIDGDGTLSGNSRHVVYLEDVTGGTLLDGVTVTGGNADGSGFAADGGGLFCDGGGSVCSPTLRNIVFTGNHADIEGGAIFNNGYGGGESSPLIVNAVFAGNTAGLDGGAIFNAGANTSRSSPRVINSTFTGNTAGRNGGAILNNGSGGGTSAPQIANTILAGNSATQSGNQIYNRGSAAPTFAHTLVAGSGGSGAGWNAGIGSDGGGNFDAAPQFADASAGAFTLTAGTPDTTGLGLPPTDLAGNPRVTDNGSGTPRVDQGAYEAPSRVVLPVELAAFEASADGAEEVRLTWETASEENNDRFIVERRRDSVETFHETSLQPWRPVTSVETKAPGGTSTQALRYTATDAALPFEAQALTYRLVQIDRDGDETVAAEKTIEIGAPQRFTLHGSFPNPMRSSTTIRYELPEEREVTVAVYDALGRKVRTLVDERQSGRQEIAFEARGLASGVYFYRITSGSGYTQARKLVLVR